MFRLTLFRLTLFLGLLAIPFSLMADDSARVSEKEQAVRACIAAYVEAFNEGDAEGLAALWSESGVWVSPDGSRLTGRQAIEEAMRVYFEENEGETLTVSGTTIRFIAPTVAVEEGNARVVTHGTAPESSTYIAIHVKQEDGWRLDSVRETEVATSSNNYESLKSLEWLIGTWSDRDGDIELETTCAWTKNKNFITRSFRVKEGDATTREGTQVIGYDAVSQSIRSWVFDAEGGIGEGTWHHDGRRWIVKSSHRLATGQLGSSINILTVVDENSHLWQSTGREIDGEILPDIAPVTVQRK